MNKHHLISIFFLIVCSTGYLFDVLFFDKHLSAFDYLLDKPSWKVEFGEIKPNNSMLSDSPVAHYPYKKEFWDATRQGYNPSYLPNIFSGKPTSGQGTGIFSTSLFQFFMEVPNALDWSTWFRLLLAGVFMYILLFQLGVGSAAATLGSIAWTYNMHQIAWLMFPQHLATQLWLPLLLGLNILVLKNGKNLAAILGLILCLVFFFSSGYTQIVLYSFIFLGIFNTLYVLIVKNDTPLGKIKNWCFIHAIYFVAGLLLLPEALWQAQEIAEGLRGTQEFRFNSYKLDISFASIVQLFKDFLPAPIEVSRFFMPNYQSDLGNVPRLKQFFRSNSVEFQTYFGLICLYFTLYGMIKAAITKNTMLLVMAIMLFLTIGLLNGNPTLISLLNLIPFAGSGAYSRIISLVLVVVIIFCAFGAKFLIEDFNNKRYIYVLMPLCVMAIWLGIAKYQHYEMLDIREFLPWIGYISGFILFCFVFAKLHKTNLILPVAIGLTFIELLLVGYNFNTRLEGRYHFPENTVISKISSAQGDFRTALLMDNTSYHHNILSYYDLSTIGGYETTAPNDYLYFIREAYKKVHVTLNGILFLFDGNLPILRLLNTRFIISNLNLDSNLITPVYSNSAETLYRFNDPLGRVYCASDQIVNPESAKIPGQLARLSTRYDRPVIVGKALLDNQLLTSDCKVSDLHVFTSKVSFIVSTDQPTLVFIPINYHNYWKAMMNSETIEIHKANYTFMSLVVPSGTNQITLEFINKKLTLQAILLIALGLFTVLIALLRIQPNWQKALFIICGCLLIGKNLLSIPGVMNTDIPQREVTGLSRSFSKGG